MAFRSCSCNGRGVIAGDDIGSDDGDGDGDGDGNGVGHARVLLGDKPVILRSVLKYANKFLRNSIRIKFRSKNSKMSISKDMEEGSTSRKDRLVLTREMPSNWSSYRVKQLYLELNIAVDIMKRHY